MVARLLARWASKCPLDAYFCAKINIAVLGLKNFLAKSSNKFAVKTAEIHFTPWMVRFWSGVRCYRNFWMPAFEILTKSLVVTLYMYFVS